MSPRLLVFGICLALGTIRCGGSSNASGSTGPAQADAGSGGSGGGGDGGTASNECDGLSADPGASSIAITPPTEACGLAATTDSSGNVALSGSSDMTTSKNWATYDRGGARLGRCMRTARRSPAQADSSASTI